jgi:hypothetical protein
VVRLALVLIVAAACSKDGGGAATGSGSAGSAAPAATVAKKAGGFSASLQAELAAEGSGSAAAPAPAAGSAGSATRTAPPAGSAAVAATQPAAGSAAVAATQPAAGSAAAAPPATGSAAAAPPAAGSAAATPAVAKPVAPVAPPVAARVPVKPSAEQAAIKMDLEPNWDRDVGEAGTISFVLKVPNSEATRLFSFHYGVDPASAPADRDAYMKWLADQKILNVTLNRQRGAAWYLEGTDASGAPAFRTRVTYGGKQLICYGSLYKDGASNQLGDLRDKVVMAAKKICETMSL